MSTQRHRAGWSWPRTLAVATLAFLGAILGTVAVPFLVAALVGVSPDGIGMLAALFGGLWIGGCVGAWVGLRITR